MTTMGMYCRTCGKDFHGVEFQWLAQHLAGFHGIVCSTYAQVMEGYSPWVPEEK